MSLHHLDPGQLDAILQHAADAITVQDLQGRLIYANDAAVRLTGFPSAEAFAATSLEELGRRFLIFDERGQPLPVERWLNPDQAGDEEGRPVILRFRMLATGEERWLVVRSRVVTEEHSDVRYRVTATQDVTEVMRGEARLRLLADASALLASSIDFDATLAEVARLAVPQLADWAAVDLIEPAGSLRRLAIACADHALEERARELQSHYPPSLQLPVGPGDAIHSGEAILIREITDEMREQAAVEEEHLRLIREMGLRSMIVVPLRARGRVLGAISFAAGESGRRYTPADLTLATELANHAALAVDNARLYQDAREAIRARDRVLSSVSHDLRTPLTTVRGMAQVLLRRVDPNSSLASPQVLERLTLLDRAANHMAVLIDDLLDLARLEDGRPLELNRQPTDLVALVSRLVDRIRDEETGHRISVQADPAEIVGDWDARRLERVVLNLLRNATKFSPSGTEIDVRLALRSLERNEAPVAELTVHDQGVGIPLMEQAQIFVRGYRKAPELGRYTTTDIGLPGARQIVEQHGGSLTVESQEGKGSTFFLRLPLKEASGGG
jgi:PAS domain S-box-containing protein